MAKIGLYFGSTTGNTEFAAEEIKKRFDAYEEDMVVLHNIADGVETMKSYQYLILGCPTWDIGELQEDWDDKFSDFEDIDFSGKAVALFGYGDARGYPDSFVDAIGTIGKAVEANNGKLVGSWHPDNYEIEDSRALFEEGNPASGFMGLPLDQENQEDWTEVRLDAWVMVLNQEFGF